MLWLRNKKNSFQLRTIIRGLFVHSIIGSIFIFHSLYVDAPDIDHRKDISSCIQHQSDTDHDHDEELVAFNNLIVFLLLSVLCVSLFVDSIFGSIFIFESLYIDAPVIDHRKDISSYIKHLSDTDHDHDEVSHSSGADKSHDMNGKMAGEESGSMDSKDSIETEKKCVLLDSDDRTTGEIQ